MYCFPYPQASDVIPLRAPYVATYTYSLTGQYTFASFYAFILSDELNGFPQRWLSALGLRILTIRQPSASLIQSWLFFGLASEALGRDVTHDEFLEKCAVGTSETSIDLRIPLWFWSELKARWERLQNTLSRAAYRRKERELEQCCALVVNLLYLQEVFPEEVDTELVVLSVHMLLYLISDIIDSAKNARTNLQSKSTQLLIQRMLKNGWCRKRLNFVDSIRMFYPELYFMSSFRPPRDKIEDHQSCTPAKCYVTTGLVEPFHRTDDCQCQDVHVPLEQVLRIVAAGGIPLIRIKRSTSGKFTLEVVPYNGTSRFTAVSHVWSDRQLGSTKNALPSCQVEYLDSMLAALPCSIRDWPLRDWLPKRHSTSSLIKPSSRAHEYFWLDTFCIPQDIQHADLKHKAIGLMNLIYAAANQTLVFDSGLQKFDAGRRPSSLVHGGRPTFYAPTDKNLLDVLAHLCASNWMGRAWTLQEGILSGDLVFPLKGSLAYLHLLRPNFDAGLSLPWVEDEAEPLRDQVRDGIFRFANDSLNVGEYRNYARGSADRGARFVNAHSRLQSRTTTMAQDLPLILFNMSGMNGNLASRSDSLDQKMKLLFYGLGTLPVELLFSDCVRLGRCEMDSWIPREIVPETFSGEHILRLCPEGFAFHQQKGDIPLKFFSMSNSIVWQDRALLSVFDRPEYAERCYVAKAATCSTGESAASSKNGWYILFEDDSPDPRAARFMINRRNGNKVFLHFDCPLRLSKIYIDTPETTEQLPSYTCTARPADSQEEFIIEKSSTPQSFSIPRPQNPGQYSDRLEIIIRALYYSLCYVIRKFLRWFLGDIVSTNWLLLIAYGVYTFMQRIWVERAVRAFVHQAWLETYSPTWSPNGPWKWFWKLSNYEPPIPFTTMTKTFLHFMFYASVLLDMYLLTALISLHWLVFVSTRELVEMCLGAFIAKVLAWLFV